MPKDSKSHYAILGVLALRPGISGYDIEKFMQTSTNYFWKEGYASIYPGLARFEKNGWVVKSLDPQISKRKRYTYVLSDSGRKELEGWICQPVQEDPVRHELLLKLFLGGISGGEMSRRHIENYQRELLEYQEAFNQVKEKLDGLREGQEKDRDADHRIYWDLTLNYGRYQVEADLRWCKEALKLLKAHKKEKLSVEHSTS